MMDAKALKKLVATCRKLGVKEFTSPDVSFKLADETPRTKAPKVAIHHTGDDVESEPELSADDLLFWSATGQDPLAQGN
jgi:hypothetical protein